MDAILMFAWFIIALMAYLTMKFMRGRLDEAVAFANGGTPQLQRISALTTIYALVCVGFGLSLGGYISYTGRVLYFVIMRL